MIVKFSKPGKSFKGVTLYLLHDPDHAVTAERVAWATTLNCAHDHIESAVHELYTTCLDAELLKAEAGVRAGGTPVEKPVKHISLAWHPSERPDRVEMTRAAEAFLKHMGWQEHQAILIAHDDKQHRHVHIVLNAIHPETGLKLDDGFERRRAQAWALGYEQETGRIFCEQRLKPVAEREPSEPRPAWLAVREQVEKEIFAEQARAEFDPSYIGRAENRQEIERNEWQILKKLQKDERIAFFTEGKLAYKDLHRAIYREVREEFRPEWGSYYAARREGMAAETLAEMRAELIARQNAVIAERREAAAAELRAARDLDYRAVLDVQKQERAELIERQERGLSSPHLLEQAYPTVKAPDADREEARESDALDRFGVRRGRATDPEAATRRTRTPSEETPSVEEAMFASPARGASLSPSRDLASGLAGGFLSIIGSLGESMSGGHTKPSEEQAPEDALARFGIRRGTPPPDVGQEEQARRKQEREAWDAWKEKRDKILER